MKIKKLPSGNYHAKVFSHRDENGKTHYVSFTSSEKTEVMQQVTDFKKQKKRGEHNLDLTIGECVDRYIKSKEKILSPSTIRGYKGYLMHIESIKNIRVSRFTSEQFQSFIGILATDHSPKTVKNIYSFVLSSIKMFSDRTFRVTLPPKRQYEYHLPVDEEIKALMKIADDEMKMCIALASIGTLRRGEICGLLQKDVDREHNNVYVHSDMVRNDQKGWTHKETPKTSSSNRRITLPSKVIAMIPDGEPDEYICKRTPNDVTDAFIDLRDELGLKCRFHDLRHYAASILHAIGVPDQYIQERGGWRSDFMLKSVYRNTISDKTDEFTKKANAYFDKGILS